MQQTAEKALDEAFARMVLKTHMATLEQLKDAIDSQSMIAEHNVHLPLGEALVRLGTITASQRAHVEELIKTQSPVLEQFGNYKIIRKLGEGKMGSVFLAEDTVALRQVALKLLPEKLAEDRELLARFKKEAQLTGKLSHINIVAAYDMSQENGRHYYVMEYCEGESLGRILAREKKIQYDRALDIVLQVAHGLKHAHNHGIVHRDIKPDNIMLTPDGTAKILDMGLAKSLSNAGDAFNTQSGMTVGTPHYMSPEQARGDEVIDGRADIYGLGATFYNLITGETPYSGSLAEVLNKHITEKVPNPQDISEDISDAVVKLVQKMMAKSPGDRYQNCDVLAADVERVLGGKMPAGVAPKSNQSTATLKAISETLPPIEELPARIVAPKGTGNHSSAVIGKPPTGQRLAVEFSERSQRKKRMTRRNAHTGVNPFVWGATVLLIAAIIAVYMGTNTGQDDTQSEKPLREGNMVNLLSLVDPQRNAVSGHWYFNGSTLVCDPSGVRGGPLCLELPYHPPEEYNYHITFTRTRGAGDITQIMVGAGKQFVWKMASYSDTTYCFELVGGKEGNINPTRVKKPGLENGRKYDALVQVRKNGVKAFIDGNLISQWTTDYSDMSNSNSWKIRDNECLGLATWSSGCEFEVAEVLEITGRGRLYNEMPKEVSITK